MKKMFFAVTAVFVAFAVMALDTTHDNDFWNTSGYVNTVTKEATIAMETAFNSELEFVATMSLEEFSTKASSVMIIVR